MGDKVELTALQLVMLPPMVRSESPAAPARGEAGLQSRAPMEEASEDIPF